MVTPDKLIFIISQPRSGSTMLQKLLSNNDQVDTVSEPWLLLPYLSVFREDLIRASYSSKVAKEGIIDYLEKKGQIEHYNVRLREFMLSLYSVNEGAKYFIDKTPRYYEILPQILTMFPEARFLVLKRSPFAALFSMLQTWSGFKTDPASLATFYRDFIVAPARIQDFLDKNKGGKSNLFEVRYEDIVATPNTHVREIYEWLGLPFSDSVLDLSGNDKVRGIYGDDVYKAKSLTTIAPDKNADWERKIMETKGLPSFFSEYSHYLGEDFLKQYGYASFNIGKSKQLFGKSGFQKLLEFARKDGFSL